MLGAFKCTDDNRPPITPPSRLVVSRRGITFHLKAEGIRNSPKLIKRQEEEELKPHKYLYGSSTYREEARKKRERTASSALQTSPKEKKKKKRRRTITLWVSSKRDTHFG